MIEYSYLEYLCSIVGAADDPGYLLLMKDLYSADFAPVLVHDQARVLDGLELRRDFGGRTDPNKPCSVLEMMIGLAKRIDFQLEDPDILGENIISEWFWSMITNLGLDICIDEEYGAAWDSWFVKERVDRLVNREYDPSGFGGLFPLMNPKEDQRNVEIWYQMNAYLREHEEDI